MSKNVFTLILLAVMASGSPVAMAEDDTDQGQVTIKKDGDKTITEYRSHGHLYMVKIEPSKGPSYFLVDLNGDGELNERKDEIGPDFAVPMWTLKKW